MGKRIFRWLAGWVAGEALRIWPAPVFGTGAAVVIGWLQELPLFYIYLGAVVSFAAISTGMLQFSQWRYRNRVEDKLVFSTMRFSRRILEDDKVKNLRFGIVLSNKALFPIQYEVRKMLTSVGDDRPPKKEYKKNIYTIPIDGTGYFDDFDIPINRTIDASEEGLIEYEIAYGRPGRLKCTIKGKKRIFFAVSDQGKIEAINWVDE